MQFPVRIQDEEKKPDNTGRKESCKEHPELSREKRDNFEASFTSVVEVGNVADSDPSGCQRFCRGETENESEKNAYAFVGGRLDACCG